MLEWLVVFYYMNLGDSMDKVYIGKIVSTHGIKGEIRILSDFPFKDKVFVVGKDLWIDEEKYTIQSYRVHKHYDMVTLNDYRDINEVLPLLKKKVYVLKKDLNLDDDEILDEELMTYKVFSSDGKEGIIQEVFLASPENKILRVFFDQEILIPYQAPFVKEIHKDKKYIVVELIDGM